jgi:hypothetical protein
MGSPADEEGRWEHEGPRSEVVIGSGFWMFETPCTQALWEAVPGEGKNPSHYQGADRPVEHVSWDDCQGFLKRLNERLDGLRLSLPSEAQWEYACRAGTETARYQENLDAIAWYRGNSGGESHAVRGKSPNGWGLYDMLGNVWEWCEDPWSEDERVRSEGSAAAPASALRVLRGGSWRNDPQYVRAAYRSRNEPGLRDVSLGFRCAEFVAVHESVEKVAPGINEQQWLHSDNPNFLLAQLQQMIQQGLTQPPVDYDERLRRFALLCYQKLFATKIRHPKSRAAAEAAERFLARQATAADLDAAYQAAASVDYYRDVLNSSPPLAIPMNRFDELYQEAATKAAASLAAPTGLVAAQAMISAGSGEEWKYQADYLRQTVGNPFRGWV